jgi:hypothetical protein
VDEVGEEKGSVKYIGSWAGPQDRFNRTHGPVQLVLTSVVREPETAEGRRQKFKFLTQDSEKSELQRFHAPQKKSKQSVCADETGRQKKTKLRKRKVLRALHLSMTGKKIFCAHPAALTLLHGSKRNIFLAARVTQRPVTKKLLRKLSKLADSDRTQKQKAARTTVECGCDRSKKNMCAQLLLTESDWAKKNKRIAGAAAEVKRPDRERKNKRNSARAQLLLTG